MAGRFDYVKYDEDATRVQEGFKSLFSEIEVFANAALKDGRAKALLMTKLEEAYMWTGKAIRDEMISRIPQTAHVPERTTV